MLAHSNKWSWPNTACSSSAFSRQTKNKLKVQTNWKFYNFLYYFMSKRSKNQNEDIKSSVSTMVWKLWTTTTTATFRKIHSDLNVHSKVWEQNMREKIWPEMLVLALHIICTTMSKNNKSDPERKSQFLWLGKTLFSTNTAGFKPIEMLWRHFAVAQLTFTTIMVYRMNKIERKTLRMSWSWWSPRNFIR